MIGKRMRHLSRYREISGALIRHGFGIFVKELGMASLFANPVQSFAEVGEKEAASIGVRIRHVLQELGPTFIKLGQLASTRPDLIPEEIINELVKLQDQVPAFSYAEVRQTIEEELGGDIGEIFLEFEEEVVAAASIGQVHRAVLNSGERVAVKVQRPNITARIETDLEILQDLAGLAEKRLIWAARYQVSDIVDEFAKSLHAELDYTIEGRNAEKIGDGVADDPHVHVPQVFWDYTTRKVLTMEYLEGEKVDKPERLRELGYDPQKVAERLANALFKQIFVEGFFHGDPHPGNVLVMPGEVLAFLDFGMVGRLTPEMKYNFSSLVIALMRQSTDGIVKSLLRMGLTPEDVNIGQLRTDVNHLREKYYGVPLSQISLGEAVNEIFNTAYRHSIRIPADLTLLGKTMITFEGVVQRLDPEFSMISIAEPFGRKLLLERLHPRSVTETVWNQVYEYGEVLSDLPKEIHELTSLAKRGRLRVGIQMPKSDPLLKQLVRIGNQLSKSLIILSFSVILAAIIIGASINGQITVSWKLPVMEIGIVTVLLLLLFLLYASFKSGKN